MIERSAGMQRTVWVLSLLGLLLVFALIISLNVGAFRLSPSDVLRTLFGYGTNRQELLLFDFRLPRITIAVLIGAGFAVSGCILQGVTRNALADPGILGINAGAGLAVILYLSFAGSGSAPIMGVPFFALLGAGGTAVLIYGLSYSRLSGISPYRMLLNGIAVASGIVAATIVLTIRLKPGDYDFVARWLAGAIWGASWPYVLALLPWMIVLVPYAIYKSGALDVLGLGDLTATGLGAPVERDRLCLYAAAVALAGSCVAVGGGIGFVGLIAPHLSRRLVGPRHRYALPVSALVGALLLVAADTIARSPVASSEIPTGIVAAIIGAPYFLYLLARSRA